MSYAVGTIVEPGPGGLGRFIEDYVPAGRTFGELHDNFVDTATNAGVPDWLANIPSMVSMYRTALSVEMLRSLGMIEQPTRPLQLTVCE